MLMLQQVSVGFGKEGHSRLRPLGALQLLEGNLCLFRAHQLLKIQEKGQMSGQQRGHRNNVSQRRQQ